jgi:hypothetical protein
MDRAECKTLPTSMPSRCPSPTGMASIPSFLGRPNPARHEAFHRQPGHQHATQPGGQLGFDAAQTIVTSRAIAFSVSHRITGICPSEAPNVHSELANAQTIEAAAITSIEMIDNLVYWISVPKLSTASPRAQRLGQLVHRRVTGEQLVELLLEGRGGLPHHNGVGFPAHVGDSLISRQRFLPDPRTPQPIPDRTPTTDRIADLVNA